MSVRKPENLSWREFIESEIEKDTELASDGNPQMVGTGIVDSLVISGTAGEQITGTLEMSIRSGEIRTESFRIELGDGRPETVHAFIGEEEVMVTSFSITGAVNEPVTLKLVMPYDQEALNLINR